MARNVPQDLGDAHYRNVFRPDDAHLAGGFHRGTAQAGEARRWHDCFHGCDQLRAVVIAGGFACRYKDEWVWLHARLV